MHQNMQKCFYALCCGCVDKEHPPGAVLSPKTFTCANGVGARSCTRQTALTLDVARLPLFSPRAMSLWPEVAGGLLGPGRRGCTRPGWHAVASAGSRQRRSRPRGNASFFGDFAPNSTNCTSICLHPPAQKVSSPGQSHPNDFLVCNAPVLHARVMLMLWPGNRPSRTKKRPARLGDWEEAEDDDLSAAGGTEVVVTDADAGPSRGGPRKARPKKRAKTTQVRPRNAML